MLGPRGRIDHFEPARKDPNVEIEVTIQAMDEYVKSGRIAGIALSEVSAQTVRRASKLVKVTAVEVELTDGRYSRDDKILKEFLLVGERLHQRGMDMVDK